jgi:hypothetical protein
MLNLVTVVASFFCSSNPLFGMRLPYPFKIKNKKSCALLLTASETLIHLSQLNEQKVTNILTDGNVSVT